MELQYKWVTHQEGLPMRIISHRKENYGYHWHKELEICYVFEGSVQIQTRNRQDLYKEGELFILNSNELHASSLLPASSIVLILQIDTSFCRIHGFDLSNYFFHFNHSGQPYNRERLKQFFAHLILETVDKKIGYQIEVMGLVNQFISYLLRNVPYTLLQEKNQGMSSTDFERLNRILEYINLMYHHRISIQDIAKEEYLNAFYLSHFFKKKVGITFSECLNQVRIHKAAEMLLSQNRKITEIAYLNGFSNIKSFNRTFKDKFGLTPLQYKKSAQIYETRGTPLHAEVCDESFWYLSKAGYQDVITGLRSFLNDSPVLEQEH